jgi:ribosome maturation factor RimP|tara:strand:- start:493 stop:945 length:453 start_codon:yes stop_codon:yes gene_type:complete
MNDIKESLFQTLNEVVEKQGIRVINISISGASNSPNIQIIIDSNDGINLENCSFVSKIAGDLIKINDYFTDDYNLEVSSPGVNRQLFSIDDFNLYLGSLVKIKLKKQLKNQKNFLGKIKSLKNDIIIISTDKEDIEIDFKNIKKANIKEI